MGYTAYKWEKGQTITAEKLIHMENGIAAALGAIKSAFGTEYTDGSEEYTVSLEDLGTSKDISAGAITGTTLKATGAVSGNTLNITTTSDLKGDVDIGGNLTVGENETNKTTDITLNGKLIVNGKDVEVDDSTVKQAADLTGTLDVSGATKLQSTLNVTGTTTLNTLIVRGTTTLRDDLTVGSANKKATIMLNDAMTIDFSALQNYVTINGDTQANGAFQVGDQNAPQPVYVYGDLNINHFATKKTQIALNNNGNITANSLTIRTGDTVLYGTTTISRLTKLIVGNSTTTVNNEIYGFTTISNLVVGEPNVESDNETQTYSGTATFNTEENFLHGTTTIDNLTALKVLASDEIHYIHGDLTLGTKLLRPNNENPELSSQTAEDDLKINSRNITIGLQSTNEYPVINANSSLTIYAETSMVGATEIQNLEYLNVTGNSNNYITGSTTITNLTVPSFVIRDQTTTNGGYSFTISNGTNLRLSQNNNNNLDFYFKNTGELIFSGTGIGITGTGYFDSALTLKNNLIFETESSNQSTSYNYIIKPSLSSANHYSLQMNINNGTSDVHTILTYYDNTEDQVLYLGNYVSNNTLSSTVTNIFLEAKEQIILQGAGENGVEVDSNLYLQSGKELRLAKSDTPNDYVKLTAAQLEQIKSYCNITD